MYASVQRTTNNLVGMGANRKVRPHPDRLRRDRLLRIGPSEAAKRSRKSRRSRTLCANMSETSSPSTITVGRGKKSHFDKHGQDKYFFRCGSEERRVGKECRSRR